MQRRDAEALDDQDPVASCRARFTESPSGAIYMDGNSLGRLAIPVREAIERGMTDWQEKLVGGWSSWIDLPVEAGEQIGKLIGASPGETLACDSTTVNLYKLAWAALRARPDRPVIVGDVNDFPTDRYVLAGLAREEGRDLRLVASDPVEGLAFDELTSVIDERTALVCLSHVNFRSAARVDMNAVTELAHRNGALVLWDLSHSAGSVPVDLGAAGADLAVGCTYKYLNAGPGAPAYLYVRRDLQDGLTQPVQGWFGQRDQFAMGPDYDPEPDVRRFLTGSTSTMGLLAARAGAELLLDVGIDRLWNKSVALTGLLVDLIRERLEVHGVTLASPADPERRGAHVSISHPLAWPCCNALVTRDLVIPDFRPPDVIRLGPAPMYTKFVEVYDAVERIEQVLASDLEAAEAPARIT